MSETYEQRLRRYVTHAMQARELAGRSRSLERKEACLTVAESWLEMARAVDTTRTTAGGTKASPTQTARELNARVAVAGGAPF